jgi:signal transduction histidine kinase
MAKYAQASKATVRVAPVVDRLVVDVEDDGIGEISLG